MSERQENWWLQIWKITACMVCASTRAYWWSCNATTELEGPPDLLYTNAAKTTWREAFSTCQAGRKCFQKTKDCDKRCRTLDPACRLETGKKCDEVNFADCGGKAAILDVGEGLGLIARLARVAGVEQSALKMAMDSVCLALWEAEKFYSLFYIRRGRRCISVASILLWSKATYCEQYLYT